MNKELLLHSIANATGELTGCARWNSNCTQIIQRIVCFNTSICLQSTMSYYKGQGNKLHNLLSIMDFKSTWVSCWYWQVTQLVSPITSIQIPSERMLYTKTRYFLEQRMWAATTEHRTQKAILTTWIFSKALSIHLGD